MRSTTEITVEPKIVETKIFEKQLFITLSFDGDAVEFQPKLTIPEEEFKKIMLRIDPFNILYTKYQIERMTGGTIENINNQFKLCYFGSPSIDIEHQFDRDKLKYKLNPTIQKIIEERKANS